MTRATGTRETIDGVEYLVLTRTFRAPIDDVWRSITESERLARWFGRWSGDPAGGRIEVSMLFEGDDAPGEPWVIDACEEPSHLRVHSDAADPAQSWTLDLRLAESDGVTTLRFGQVLTADLPVRDVGPGWDYYLDRLSAAQAGEDVGAIVWEPYPALGEEYGRRFES